MQLDIDRYQIVIQVYGQQVYIRQLYRYMDNRQVLYSYRYYIVRYVVRYQTDIRQLDRLMDIRQLDGPGRWILGKYYKYIRQADGQQIDLRQLVREMDNSKYQIDIRYVDGQQIDIRQLVRQVLLDRYRGIQEKGSGDFISAVCVQRDRQCIQCNKQLRQHLPNPFREFPCWQMNSRQILDGQLGRWIVDKYQIGRQVSMDIRWILDRYYIVRIRQEHRQVDVYQICRYQIVRWQISDIQIGRWILDRYQIII